MPMSITIEGTAFPLGEIKRKDVWSIPLTIFREALVNAIVHADYSQRGAPIRDRDRESGYPSSRHDHRRCQAGRFKDKESCYCAGFQGT